MTPRCQPVEAEVTIRVNETMFRTITEVGNCQKCKVQTVGIRCDLKPIVVPVPDQKPFDSDPTIEGHGHAYRHRP
jgi:hypothetical protein